jgi:PAS domain S-box-containing protein
VRHSPLSSLRFRLSLLILAAVIPAVVLNVYATLQQQRWAVEEVRQNALRISRTIAEEQGQVAGGVEELLTAFSLVPAVRGADPELCPATLAGFLARYPHYTSLSVIRPDGRLVCRGLRPGEPAHVYGLAVENAFRSALESRRFAIGEYAQGTITGKLVVPFALPVFGDDGRSDVVLTATLDLLWLARFSGNPDLPRGTTVTVVEAGGKVLGHFPRASGGDGRLPQDDWLLAQIRDGRKAGVSDAIGSDGTPLLYAFSLLPGPDATPVAVAVGIPRVEAFSVADRMLARNLALLAIFGLIAVALGWWVGTRGLLQPVRSVVSATRRVASGELDARAAVSPHGGELAELAESFNEMAATLERRTAETARSLTALIRSETRYRSLVEASAAIVWDMPASGEIATEQPRWAEFTGQSFEEYRGWGWLDAIHSDDRARIALAWAAAVDDRAQFHAELRLRRSDGEHRHMVARATPILSNEGSVREWIGVYTDVTERNRVESERAELLLREQELRVEAERSSRAKSDFLAIVSHELRTPLTSIISYTELLESDVGGELATRHREFVSRIDASAWHLKDLVDQILEFTRLEAGRVTVNPMDAEMSDLVRGVVADLAPIAAAKSLPLEAEVPDEPLVVRTDALKVRQILLNLVSNAVKFCDAGEVRVEAARRDGQVEIRVRDTGPGIAPEHQEEIWESFRQVESALTRRSGGTGLGLPIARRLTRLLGGTLNVESELGVGSTFALSLPIDALSGAGSAESAPSPLILRDGIFAPGDGRGAVDSAP